MAKSKRGLGKGLGALIPHDASVAALPDSHADSSKEMVVEINVNDIMPNKNQPRRQFDREKLRTLEDSISKHGIVQPIVVKQVERGYEIVAGERRWRASKNIGLKSVAAIVRSFDELQQAQVALIENLQREDLNDIEEAMAYQSLIDEHALTQQSVAEAVGKSRTYITNTLRLLKLDQDIQGLIAEGQISGGHGRALLSVDNLDTRTRLVEKVVSEGLSVRETEKLAAKTKTAKSKVLTRTVKDNLIVEYESDLQSRFGTKVNIKQGKKRGKIEIEYYNEDDLTRILQILKDK